MSVLTDIVNVLVNKANDLTDLAIYIKIRTLGTEHSVSFVLPQ